MSKFTNRVSHGTEQGLLRIQADGTEEQIKTQMEIVRKLKAANALLEEAAALAEKAGLPFDYAVMTHDTRDEWISSEDCYGSWDQV